MNLREKKAMQKKEAIMKAAISVFAEKTYQGATLEDVAQRLLMTKGAVYYYFKDKQDLLYQSQVYLLENSLNNIAEIEESDLPAEEKVSQAISQHIEYVIHERTGFESMLSSESILSNEQYEHILRLQNGYEKHFDELIQEGITQGVFIQADIKIVRNLILGAMNWLMHWYSEGGKKSKHELSKMIAFYLMRMVLKTPNDQVES
ncbi:TetR/AcrR family transcriptional regulator [Psychrobacillus soli]|uniref:TetR/AcrR family transcriptional regulator n=1 Tax=Psychrobacillus soli TaxID=1543965 RepID=A0A544TM61_9BACI|nr:TetR/AcrR family transcriptional regulator [Psychrobacillus soli]TQR18525.1 TetR/AcrR family transcriptional regulator [Psychrobacillus soli]